MTESDTKLSLPEGWVSTKLGNICELTAGGAAPQGDEFFTNGRHPFVRVQDMGRLGNAMHISDTRDHLNDKGIVRLKVFPKGTVLFTKSGMSTLLNQRAILPRDMFVVSHIGVIMPSIAASSEWIYYYLKTVDFKELTHATTLPSLPLPKVAGLYFPIPPLPEQYRIVSKIEELFTKLDAGVEALKKIQVQLKRYRQSVLKSAFNGELTKEWRKTHKGELEPSSVLLEKIKEERNKSSKYKELRLLDTSDLPELPKGWVWERVGTCSNLITKGASPKWQGFNYVEEGILFIRSENVLWGYFNFSSITNIPKEFHLKLKQSQVIPDDVVINIVGASIGRCAVVPPTITEANINQAVALIRTNKILLPHYLMRVLSSPQIQKDVRAARVETARPNISLADLNNLVIPVPSVLEQSVIIEQIDRHFSIAENIENTIAVSLKQSERLRQSILKKAFEGKLVPQNPEDEPAEKLLARIKIEKAKGKVITNVC